MLKWLIMKKYEISYWGIQINAYELAILLSIIKIQAEGHQLLLKDVKNQLVAIKDEIEKD